MRIYDAVFYGIVFFILGVFFAGLKINFLIVFLSVAFFAVLFLIFRLNFNLKNFGVMAALSFAAIPGFLYYLHFGFNQIKAAEIVFGKKIVFSGVIVDYPEQGSRQKIIVELQPLYGGRIIANLKPFPSFGYGDLIQFEGNIKKPFPEGYADYLAKDGIFGVSDFPKAELVARNSASGVKSRLFKLKEEIILVFQKVLPPQKASFLSGITLGERAEFSREFKEEMNKSGTAHLAALSGYNITVVGAAAGAFFGWFLNKKRAFYFSVAAIAGFAAMTGAEASVVRAAIMGFIALLAKRTGRVHSMRNAIAVSAFLMILINPKVLRFDLGFQLSFLALLGIVYLSPAIGRIFKIKKESGFLNWRENFLITTSAQLAVAPLLIANSGGFSLTSFLANILILEAIPLTMFFGFLTAAAGFLFMPLATVLGWFTGLFLSYELAIIKLFSEFSVVIQFFDFFN